MTLVWTSEVPTEAGWYWCRDPRFRGADIIWHIRWPELETEGHEDGMMYAGPIPLPVEAPDA